MLNSTPMGHLRNRSRGQLISRVIVNSGEARFPLLTRPVSRGTTDVMRSDTRLVPPPHMLFDTIKVAHLPENVSLGILKRGQKPKDEKDHTKEASGVIRCGDRSHLFAKEQFLSVSVPNRSSATIPVADGEASHGVT